MTYCRVACLAALLCASGTAMPQVGPQASDYIKTPHEPEPGIHTTVESWHKAGHLGRRELTYQFCNDSDKPIIFWWEGVGAGSVGTTGWGHGCGYIVDEALVIKPKQTIVKYFAFGKGLPAMAFMPDEPPSDHLDERFEKELRSKLDAPVWSELTKREIRARVEVHATYQEGVTTLDVTWEDGIYALALGGLLNDGQVFEQFTRDIQNDAELRNRVKVVPGSELPKQDVPPVLPDSVKLGDQRFVYIGTASFSHGGKVRLKVKSTRPPTRIASEPLILYNEKLHILFIVHYSVQR